MFAFACHRPVAKTACTAVVLALFVLSAVSQGGCADSKPAYAANTSDVAVYVPQSTTVEGDGLPSQAAPPTRIHQLPDDPTQPFSHNYGGPNPAVLAPVVPAAKAAATDAPAIPADILPDVRRRMASVGYATE